MASRSIFQYQSLAEGEFRLLELGKVQQGQPLCGTIKHYWLETAPAFKALSYVCGSDDDPGWINLGNGYGSIRQNLQKALHAIRDHHNVTLVWVDQLCIDQTNVDDRNRHLHYMRKIYAKAEEVAIWLGDADDATPLAIDVAKRIAHSQDLPIEDCHEITKEQIEKGVAAVNEELRHLDSAWVAREPDDATDDEIESTDSEGEDEFWNDVAMDTPEDRRRLRREIKRASNLLTALDLRFDIDFIKCMLTRSIMFTRDFQRTTSTTMPRRIADIFSELALPAGPDVLWAAVCSLYSRSWFHRTWTLQEVVVSTKATVIIGKYKISWHALVIIDDWFKAIGVFASERDRVSEMALRRRRLNDEFLKQDFLEEPLLDLIEEGRSTQCMDPRDKIFAVIGLASEDHITSLQPDYRTPMHQVYEETTRYVIKTTRNLDIFGFVDKPKSSDLPSWVPDWRTVRQGTNIVRRRGTRPHNACNSLEVDIVQDSPGTIGLKGKFAGYIRNTSVCSRPSARLGYGNELSKKPLVDSVKMAQLYDINEMVFDAWANLLAAWFPDGYGWTDELMIDVFWQVLIAGMLIHGTTLNQSHQLDALNQLFKRYKSLLGISTRLMMGFLGNGYIARADWEGSPSFWAFAGAMCVGRRIFKTNTQFVGIAPSHLRIGDRIAVLRGGITPFVLRPVGNDKYELIGPAYVHGIMSGEVYRQRGTPEQTINLV